MCYPTTKEKKKKKKDVMVKVISDIFYCISLRLTNCIVIPNWN